MKLRLFLTFLIPCLFLTSIAPGQVKKPITNDDVVQMVRMGFEEGIVIKAIEANDTDFDMSVPGLLALKSSGVSQAIIEAMLNTQAGKRTQHPAPNSTHSDITHATTPSMPLKQPYAFFVTDTEKLDLATNTTQIAQADSKGQNLASIAADGAVDSVLTTAAATAIGQAAGAAAIATGSSMAMFGIIGAGAAVVSDVVVRRVLRRQAPTITYVWALPGQKSPTALSTTTPKFELVYGDIPGVNPDEFQPSIVKLVPTNNNWRIVGATRAKRDLYKASTRDWEVYSGFVEETVPVRVRIVGRGDALLEPVQPLAPGEYGLVLRPVSKGRKFAGTAVTSAQGEGLAFNSVWDFSVSAGKKSETQ